MPARKTHALTAALLLTAGAHAQTAGDAATERAALTELRATTTALIDALVEQGLLTRAKADALMAKARTQATAGDAAVAAHGWGQPAKPVVRVPYLSETARAQIKSEIKGDVIATARDEGWVDLRVLPDWVRGVRVLGDVRMRAESDRFDSDNLAPEAFRSQSLSGTPIAWAPDLTNTLNNRKRLTLRARLGVQAKINDDVTAEVRLATGNTASNPTSESTTLGNGFNRLSVGIDRAWLRWEPLFGLRLDAGRMPVPFDGGDLLWPDDLNLDGAALRGEYTLATGLVAQATLGAFMMEDFATQSSANKWLQGAQLGLAWDGGGNWSARTAVGAYSFRNVAGERATAPPPTGVLAGLSPYLPTQYPVALRQKGNTLMRLNMPGSTDPAVWGLASRFAPWSLTAGIAARHFEPVTVGLAVDMVRNTGFDLADIERRTGVAPLTYLSPKTLGYQARLNLTRGSGKDKGDWSAFAALRHFERDAWVDAYTDTTWHLGGTNYRGFSVGGQYALDKRTMLGLRYTSTRNLDDGYRYLQIPGDPTSVSGNMSSAPLRIDVLQLDATVAF